MIIKHLLLALVFIFGVRHCFAQLPQNLTKSDSTVTKNFNYIVNAPRPDETKAVVVLIPGLFDPPLSIFFESDLPAKLNKQNYAVIIPVLSQKGDRYDLSDKSTAQLSALITQYMQTSELSKDTPIILGGFSIGGTRLLKALSATAAPMKALNITHVFAIDPPLDINRLLLSDAKYGNPFLKDVLEQEIGTLNYEKLSSFSVVDVNNLDNTKAPHAKDTKIRIYSEPAIDWHIMNRKRDLLDLNLLDISGYVNHMKRKYPDINIELILSKIEGMRKQTGQRNPHSWNIVDTVEFMEWISK